MNYKCVMKAFKETVMAFGLILAILAGVLVAAAVAFGALTSVIYIVGQAITYLYYAHKLSPYFLGAIIFVGVFLLLFAASLHEECRENGWKYRN